MIDLDFRERYGLELMMGTDSVRAVQIRVRAVQIRVKSVQI